MIIYIYIYIYSSLWKCGWREKSSPRQPQIYFFNWFCGDNLFSSLVSFAVLCSCFFCFFYLLLCSLKSEIYILGYLLNIFWSTMRAGEWWKNFHPANFLKQDYFLWSNNCSESNFKKMLVIDELEPCICFMNIVIWSRKRVDFRQNFKEQRCASFNWFKKKFKNFMVKDVNSDLCYCIILCIQVKK